MILELDVGNSRIKWRLLETAKSGVLSKGLACNLAELKAHFVNQRSVTQVRVASVRDQEFTTKLSEWSQLHWGVRPDVARVFRDCGGLRVAYQDLNRLGVDRWLAMLAAYDDAASACVVVDCGTALTIDLISANGAHLGGFIVPGLQLLTRALTDNTNIVLNRADHEFEMTPGNSTEDAVYNGALTMLVAFIEKILANELTQQSDQLKFKIYLTGGDADLICHFLSLPSGEIKIIPDLVFDGLAVALKCD